MSSRCSINEIGLNIDGLSIVVKQRSAATDRQTGCCKCKTHLVLFHGWLGTSLDMSDVAVNLLLNESLGNQCCCAILVDIPYHGGSIDLQPNNLPAAAILILHSISVLLTRLPPSICRGPPLTLIGYSLGGRLALEMYDQVVHSKQNFPFLPELYALILVSSAPPANHDQLGTIRKHATTTASKLTSVESSFQFAEWLQSYWYATQMWGNIRTSPYFDKMIKRRVDNFSTHQRDAWAEAVVALDRSSMTSLPGTDIKSFPVLYMHGTHDLKYASFVPIYQTIFHTLQSTAIPAAGHNVILQAPQAVVKSFVSFLSSTFRNVDKKQVHFCLKTLDVVPYSIPLVRPIKIGKGTLIHREGVYLLIGTDVGIKGVGEVSPLPGLHSQSLSDVEKELGQLREQFCLLSQYSICSFCVKLLDFEVFTDFLPPVVCHGVECALIHIVAQVCGNRENNIVARLVQPLVAPEHSLLDRISNFVSINGVLPRNGVSENTQQNFAENAYLSFVLDSPYRTVKLKVGTSSEIVEDARAVTDAAQACMEAGKTLRLDANREWELEDFLKFELELEEFKHGIEFIEEPVKDGSQLKELLTHGCRESRGRLPIALDESLDDQSFEWVQDFAQHCSALVVKPAVTGSLKKISRYGNIARHTNCDIVISSVFESGIGIAWNAILASVYDTFINCSGACSKPSHGLGTFAYLAPRMQDPDFVQSCLTTDRSIVDVNRCHYFLNQFVKQMNPHLAGGDDERRVE